MMPDLFTQFDPSVSALFSFSPLLFWMSNLFVLYFFMPNLSASFISVANWSFMSRFYARQVLGIEKFVAGSNLFGGSKFSIRLFFVTWFMGIALLNLFGLFPGVFSVTSHFLFSVTLGVPVWLGSVFYAFHSAPMMVVSHWVGTGVPMVLAPALGIIEVLSMVIRPIALSVRLVANILAGHAITSIMANGLIFSTINLTMVGLVSLMFAAVGFFYFEMGVGMVQAGVFTGLLMIYFQEAPQK